MMIRSTIIINTNAKKDAKTSGAVSKRGSFASQWLWIEEEKR